MAALDELAALTEEETQLIKGDRRNPGPDYTPPVTVSADGKTAYFSKADAYLKLDRQMEATSHLRYILNQFPNSTAAQRAEERLRSLQ